MMMMPTERRKGKTAGFENPNEFAGPHACALWLRRVFLPV